MTEAVLLHDDKRKKSFADLFGERYEKSFTDPVAFRTIYFYSPPVSQEYRQNYKVLSRNLFAETVYRRRKGFNQEILNHYIEVSGKRLDAILKLLSLERDRMREVAFSNGAEIDAGYMHRKEHMIPIIHPHAGLFIKCLEAFDQLLQLSGTLFLHGIFDSEQRRQVEVKARGAIRQFSNVIRNESVKMRKEAQRLAKEGNGTDVELDTAIAGQEEAERQAEAQVQADRMGLEIPDGIDPELALANAKAAASASRSEQVPQEA